MPDDFSRIAKWGALLGVVFALGYWTAQLRQPGLRLDALHAHEAQLSEAELKSREKEYEAIQDKLKLSYYQQLTKAPRQTVELPQRDDQPAPKASPDLEPPVSAPVAEVPAEQAQADESPEPKAPAAADNGPSSDRMAKALAKVLGTQTPDSVANTGASSLPTSTGSPFAVQVASLPDRKIAEQLLNRLIIKGYDAKLVQGEVDGRGVVFRVRIHGFKTRADADAAKDALNRKEALSAITVSQS